MGVAKDADAASVSAGDQIGFTITLTNSGAGIARNVSASDLLPSPAGTSWSIDAAGSSSGWSLAAGMLSYGPADLAPGASVHVHVVSPTSKESCGKVDNQASVTTSNDGSAQDEASVVVNCGQIALNKVADAATVSAGDQIGFTLTLSNTGAGTARNVAAVDLLPSTPGTSWSIDAGGSSSGWSLAAGSPSY